ncbi:hypothetical protein AB0952_34795 [Streptomyces caniferus]|uniref:hypothetical protein n=1 Tax=Streptomyces caniferus TaxID=285557 RepID=UPI0034513852
MHTICVMGGSRYVGNSWGFSARRRPACRAFSFDRHDALSNARAKKLGFSFSHTIDRLPGAVAEALDTAAAPAA